MTETETVQALAAEVAAHLGDGWSLEVDPEPMRHGAHIIGPDDVFLFLRDLDESYCRANERGKVEVSTSTHKLPGYQHGDAPYRPYGEKRPEIMVSKSRGAAVIAREITRRLLPAAVEETRETRDRIARRIANANASQAVAEELAALIPGTSVREDRSGGREVSGIGWRHPNVFGHLSVSHDGTRVGVEVRGLSLETARRLAVVLADGVDQ